MGVLTESMGLLIESTGVLHWSTGILIGSTGLFVGPSGSLIDSMGLLDDPTGRVGFSTGRYASVILFGVDTAASPPIPDNIRAALALYKAKLAARFGARLIEVSLFGSWAR